MVVLRENLNHVVVNIMFFHEVEGVNRQITGEAVWPSL
jgi:hypothetical protein